MLKPSLVEKEVISFKVMMALALAETSLFPFQPKRLVTSPLESQHQKLLTKTFCVLVCSNCLGVEGCGNSKNSLKSR